MTDVPDIEIRFEDLPGRKSFALIVCDLPDESEAILGFGPPEVGAGQLLAFRRRLEVEARKAAAAFVAGWGSPPITKYLSGFKAYELDPEDLVAFDREVVERLADRLRDDDPFRVAVALTADLGLSADRRIIDLIDPLLEEVNEVSRKPGIISAAAQFMEMSAIGKSPSLKALVDERKAATRPKP